MALANCRPACEMENAPGIGWTMHLVVSMLMI